MFVSLQRGATTRPADLQERHRSHLHVVLLQTEPSGTWRGELVSLSVCLSVCLYPSLTCLSLYLCVSQIHTSLINGRPGADDLTSELLNFTSARYIRLRLQRIRTLNADLMTLSAWDPRDIDPIVTRRVRQAAVADELRLHDQHVHFLSGRLNKRAATTQVSQLSYSAGRLFEQVQYQHQNRFQHN